MIIANNPDIGFNNTIGSDAIIGFDVEALSNVIIWPLAYIDEETFIDRDVVVGRSVATGRGVQIAPEAIIRDRTTIGAFASIGVVATCWHASARLDGFKNLRVWVWT